MKKTLCFCLVMLLIAVFIHAQQKDLSTYKSVAISNLLTAAAYNSYHKFNPEFNEVNKSSIDSIWQFKKVEQLRANKTHNYLNVALPSIIENKYIETKFYQTIDRCVSQGPFMHEFVNKQFTTAYDAQLSPQSIRNSVVVDTDNDGVDDEFDLDNDNDGISDVDECTTAISYQDSFETPGITALGLGTDSDADGEFDIYLNQNSIEGWNTVFGNNFDIIHDLNNTSDGLQSVDMYGLPNAATLEKTFSGFTPGKPVAFSIDYSSAALLFGAGVWIDYGAGFFLAGTLSPNSIATPNIPGVVGQRLTTVTWTTFSQNLNPTGSDITVRLASTTIGLIQTGVIIDNVKLSQACEDTDNDGLTDNYDTDSDGDGCSDADEAYYGMIADADPDNDGVYGTGPPTVDANGQVVGAGYNTTNNYYKDATIVTCNDNDSDGVPDFVDLDDDNDGITDDDECTSELLPLSATFSYSYAQDVNGDEANHFGEQGTGNNDDPEHIFDGDLGTELRMHEDDFIEFNLGQTIAAGTTFTLTEAGGGNDEPVSIYISLGTTDAAGDANSGAGNGVGYENAVTNGQSVLIISNGDSDQTLTFTAPIDFDHVQFLGLSNHGGWAEMAIDPADQTGVNYANCDTDGDTIPDYLDTDSDNDGCSDADEAYYGLITDADPDNDGVYGSGTPTVDANGQVIGAGYNTTNNYYKDSTIVTCDDNDSDGVPDFVDLDDDNDGITDEEECTSELLPISSTFSYSYAQDIDGNEANHFGEQGTGNNDDPEFIFDGDLNTELRMHEDDFIEFNMGQTISAGTTFTLTEAGGGNDDPVSIYISLGTTDAAGDTNSGSGGGVGYLNAVTNGQSVLVISSGDSDQTLTFTAPIDFDHIQFLGMGSHGGWAEMTIDPTGQTGVNYANCDTDGDSIPNHLDADSDGDGCSDADEAYYGLIADADPDNDGIYGSGTPTVDANGQVVGAGYNTTNNYYLDSTSNTCNDNDNDGVPDFVDLDDDNDGVTDEEECTQEVTYSPIASSYSYSYAQDIGGNEAEHFGENGTGNNDDPEFIFDGDLNTELRMHEDDFIEFNMGQTILAGTTLTLTEAGGGNDDPVSIYISLGTTDATGDANSGTGGGVGYQNAATNGQSVLVISSGDSNQTLTFTAPIDFDHIQFLGLGSHGGWAEMSIDPGTQSLADYSNCDLDGDGLPNYFDLDSDGDGCSDTLEAGFTDPDKDGVLGTSPVTVDVNGLVTGQGGYIAPVDTDSNLILDYLEVGPDSNSNGISDTCESDLSLKKGVNNSEPEVGDVITFQLIVSNDGPSSPSQIRVKDIIPDDFTYSHPNFITSQGSVTFTPATGEFVWNLGSYILTAGTSIALTYSVTVNKCGEFINSAEITNSSLFDPDSVADSGN